METDAVRQNLLNSITFMIREVQLTTDGPTVYDDMDLSRMNKLELTDLRGRLCDLLFDPEGEE